MVTLVAHGGVRVLEATMKTIQSKTNPAWVLILISCFMTIHVHADTGRLSLFTKSCGPLITDFSVAEPYAPGIIPDKITFHRPNLGTMIMGGVLGNILGSLAGLYLGARMSSRDEDDLGPLILGYGAGSALGSAAGASLAGYSREWKGSLGMATIGAVLGVGISWLIVSTPTFQGDAGMLALVPLLILPPVGAAILYNSSLRPRRLAHPGALLNFSAGKFGLGVPDINIRPLFVPGVDVKPELQFNVKVLSVLL